MFFIFCLLRQGSDKIESEKGSLEILFSVLPVYKKAPENSDFPRSGLFLKIPTNSVN